MDAALSIIDHLGINVSDYQRSRAFYLAALAPLGITLLREFGPVAGFGREGKPELWVGCRLMSFQLPEQLQPITPVHVSLRARNRAEVDAFHRAALAAGGRDFGGPGVRSQYHPRYYGAFALDPDGHNLEAVFHGE
jgi:catechol 2,3-dioxygenase-like lactoylglutathione lyase family enzyme